MENMLCLPGFGDDASMFDNLLNTELPDFAEITALDLYGPKTGPVSLKSLAKEVASVAKKNNARIVLAHSVASIIASFAAKDVGCPIETIVSLEGNLTAEDAYFSGTAADYDTPSAFLEAFLARLEELGRTDQMVNRYRNIVEAADPRALWELGTDARRFSTEHVPGEVLMAAANVLYIYNPENLPQSSLDWLAESPIRRVVVEASHWMSIDAANELALILIGEIQSR